jgi:hypothetical protein
MGVPFVYIAYNTSAGVDLLAGRGLFLNFAGFTISSQDNFIFLKPSNCIFHNFSHEIAFGRRSFNLMITIRSNCSRTRVALDTCVFE